jgi:hypothetical protein
MNLKTNHLSGLAARIRWGDPWAAEELRRELVPQMVRIVRRALRLDGSANGLELQIHAEADRLRAQCAAEDEGEALVCRVAGNLCESLIGRLRRPFGRGLAPMETVLN